MSGILEIKRGAIDVASLNDGEFYLNKGKNTVQIGSGSSILTLLPVNKTISGNIILNGNVYADNLTGSAALSASITSTENIGGIDSGTTFSTGTDFTALFGQLIAPYQKPILSGLKLKYTSNELQTTNREVGDVISFNKIIITSSLENPGANYAQSLSISSSTTTPTFFEFLGNATSQNSEFTLGSIQDVGLYTAGDAIFTINGLSSTGVSLEPVTISISYYFSNNLCASSTIINSTSTAQYVLDSDLVDSSPTGDKNWVANCNSDNNDSAKWTYIIYPASYGNLSSIAQGHTDVFGAFTQLTNTDTSNENFTINNSNNIPTTYYVYKSNAPGAFANGVVLTIA
jgi:hypothetical protein